MDYINSITEAIGHTPLLKLNRVAKDAGANVFVKLEHLNPSGSYKDRMALAMIEAAERGDTWNGRRVAPGGTIVEASAGNTAPAVAMVCAAKGYKCKIYLYRYQIEGGTFICAKPLWIRCSTRSAIGRRRRRASRTPGRFCGL